MTTPCDIGGRFKSIRNQRHMTLHDAAAKSGLSVSFLSDIERGRTKPSLDTIDKLVTAYNTVIILEFEPVRKIKP